MFDERRNFAQRCLHLTHFEHENTPFFLELLDDVDVAVLSRAILIFAESLILLDIAFTARDFRDGDPNALGDYGTWRPHTGGHCVIGAGGTTHRSDLD